MHYPQTTISRTHLCMHKSKLIEIIRALEPKERKHFEDWLLSPYFNKNEQLLRLYKYILKYKSNDFTGKQIAKENTFKYLFKREKYSDQKLRNLMRKLTELLEQFLIYEEMESNKRLQSRLLVIAYQKRFLTKLFQQQVKQAKKELEKLKIKDIEYYYDLYLLEDKLYSFKLRQNDADAGNALQKMTKVLDYHYLSNKLRYCCAMLNMQSVFSVDIEVHLLEEILAYLDNHPLDDIPTIGFYHRLYLLIKNADEQQYFTLKAMLSGEPELAVEELRHIHIALFNFCNLELKSGRTEFLREIFDLFQLGLGLELYVEEGFITPPMFYRNAVMAALRSGELEWAEQFINEYKDKLRPEIRESLYSYCLAAYYFYKQEYRETLFHLLSFDFQNPYNYIEHKILLAETYYELEEDEALEGLIHATRTYLRRNTKIPDHFKQPYMNFFKIVVKLLKVRYGEDKVMGELPQLLVDTQQLVAKEWLTEKVNGIGVK